MEFYWCVWIPAVTHQVRNLRGVSKDGRRSNVEVDDDSGEWRAPNPTAVSASPRPDRPVMGGRDAPARPSCEGAPPPLLAELSEVEDAPRTAPEGSLGDGRPASGVEEAGAPSKATSGDDGAEPAKASEGAGAETAAGVGEPLPA